MIPCFFISDLHGQLDRYHKLLDALLDSPPAALFIGGDILPHPLSYSGITPCDSFISSFLLPQFVKLRLLLRERYPEIFVILGNDDGRMGEDCMYQGERRGLWKYINNKKVTFGDYDIYGYCFVPPTPFMLKDWERFDVSRYVGPGAVSPEDGYRSFEVSEHDLKYSTMSEDLKHLTENNDLSRAVFLFHAPPHETNLDRVASDNKYIDYVPLDKNVGSISIRRLIEEGQPHLTLHGHIHESAAITGSWQDCIGKTLCFSAAHDGPELAIVKFDLENPEGATRELL
jgi:Icc-related predicted phosphoesterase